MVFVGVEIGPIDQYHRPHNCANDQPGKSVINLFEFAIEMLISNDSVCTFDTVFLLGITIDGPAKPRH